mmetsp:Transcript_93001/g.259093  ORF Transcript_93001/g.259093 Transcript_93001/m.259093 type:complete len:266 (-) Transcript_93001:1315-2112(-)
MPVHPREDEPHGRCALVRAVEEADEQRLVSRVVPQPPGEAERGEHAARVRQCEAAIEEDWLRPGEGMCIKGDNHANDAQAERGARSPEQSRAAGAKDVEDVPHEEDHGEAPCLRILVERRQGLVLRGAGVHARPADGAEDPGPLHVRLIQREAAEASGGHEAAEHVTCDLQVRAQVVAAARVAEEGRAVLTRVGLRDPLLGRLRRKAHLLRRFRALGQHGLVLRAALLCHEPPENALDVVSQLAGQGPGVGDHIARHHDARCEAA